MSTLPRVVDRAQSHADSWRDSVRAIEAPLCVYRFDLTTFEYITANTFFVDRREIIAWSRFVLTLFGNFEYAEIGVKYLKRNHYESAMIIDGYLYVDSYRGQGIVALVKLNRLCYDVIRKVVSYL